MTFTFCVCELYMDLWPDRLYVGLSDENNLYIGCMKNSQIDRFIDEINYI